ncbi:cell division protein FtsZ [Candidatus Jorgensenbacteria bacterium RIFCSPLOWO2_01_FULL_45_25b]|uniref:Cell division protein FtsZ n=1 Tax=Candidatus Jorgensenbacteria bacterium RIFCSPLOWO2_01_FULL_45_25b TaxID=1798471 RepID=A0A1F6BZG6_9BACT|nr:MAG: cell division protein FtsZ [Candidatus Jorgensenbacteria bacterium RIFCSPLOWO2_01_FULL_45_25b]
MVGAERGITSIKVIGVGGGGGNAISRMMEEVRMRGVEFIAANTDAQDLDYARAHKKIYIGKALTRGLGSGMNPDIGKQAAEENRSEIGEALEGADVVFITSGMGGGTGTGASPIIAEIAKEKGILTVAIVTKPFSFEGTQRMNIGQEGLMRLKDKVDAMVVIPNDRIFSIIDKETSIVKAFSHVDEILKNAVQGIAELINMPGIINVDFADIRSIMKEAGTTLIGIGTAQGADRATKAVTAAINSPLLETSIEGARGVLFSISGSKDLKMSEVNEIAKIISGNIDPSAKVIFGAYHDSRLKEKKLKVTVIATGFNNSATTSRFEIPALFAKEKTEKDDFLQDLFKTDAEKQERKKDREGKEEKPITPESPKKIVVENQSDNSWDIPAFLRKNKKRK